jgi:hypothetical protein
MFDMHSLQPIDAWQWIQFSFPYYQPLMEKGVSELPSIFFVVCAVEIGNVCSITSCDLPVKKQTS